MTDAWPSQISCGVVDFDLAGGTMSGGAPGGLPDAVGPSTYGPHWIAKVSQLPLVTAAHIAAARALEARLDGGAGSVLINCCVGGLSPQTPGGTLTAAMGANAASGSTTIIIAMSGDFTPLVGGEMLNIDHGDPSGVRLYAIAEVTGGTDDLPRVRITPALRADTPVGTAVTFDNLVCPMRLADVFDLAVNLGRFSGIEATFTEAFPDSYVIQPSAGGFPVRYRRIRSIHTHDGDTYFSPATIGFLAAFAGSDMSGTLIGSAVFNGTHLGDATDGVSITAPDLAGAGGWIGIRSTTALARPKEIYLASQFAAEYDRMPSEFVYEEGVEDPADPDNAALVVWTVVKHFTNVPDWYGDEGRYYAIAAEATSGFADDTWRKQRIRCLTTQGNAWFGLETFKLFTTTGDTSPAPETLVGWFVVSGSLGGLEDGLFSSICSVQMFPTTGGVGGWFGKDAGRSPIARYEQLTMASQFFGADQAPIDFVFEATNWAGDWVELKRWTGEATWPGDTARTYDLRAA